MWQRLSIGVLTVMTGLVLFGQAPSIAQNRTTIVYWDFVDPTSDSPRGKALANDLAAFQKQYPNIAVRVEVQPALQIGPRMVQAAAASRTPDVARQINWVLPNLVAAGALRPMDDVITRDGTINKETFLTSWDSSVVDGHKVAVPFELRYGALYYRKDLLDQKGLAAPKTVEDVCRIGKILNTGGTMGFALGLAASPTAPIFNEWYVDYLTKAGGTLFDAGGHALFNSPQSIRVFQLVRELMFKCDVMTKETLSWDYTNVQDGLANGRVAMGYFGTHRYFTILGQLASKSWRMQVEPAPTFAQGGKDTAFVDGFHLVIGANTKNAEAAFVFIKYMVSPQAQVNRVKLTGELPTQKAAYNDPWFRITVEGRNMARWKDIVVSKGVMPNYPKQWPTAERLILQAGQEAILNPNKPLKEILDAATAAYNQSVR